MVLEMIEVSKMIAGVPEVGLMLLVATSFPI